MRLLVDRLRRLRWMAVPIAAYLVITLGLPAANGALDGAFLRHAAWVLAGCTAIVALALAASVAAHLAGRGARRLANRGRPASVASPGGSR